MHTRHINEHGVEFAVHAVYARGSFWQYKAVGVWAKVSISDVEQLITQVWARLPVTKRQADLREPPSTGKIQAVLGLMMSDANDSQFFEASPSHGLGMRNGYLTVVEDEICLLAPSPRWRCRSYVDANYDPKAGCPMWLEYLEEITTLPSRKNVSAQTLESNRLDAEKKRLILQEFVGSCVTGDVSKYQKCLLIFGASRSGRRLFTDVVTTLFNASSVVSVPPQDWSKRFCAHPMVGARMNIVSELPDRAWCHNGRFNDIVTGSAVVVEQQRKDPYTASITCGHIFASSNLPLTNNTSRDDWRRFLLVELSQRFDENASRDLALTEKIISTELAGISQWAMLGALRLKANTRHTKAAKTTEQLLASSESSHPLNIFVRVAIVPPSATDTMKPLSTPAARVFKAYKSWCTKTRRPRMSETGFGRSIKVLLPWARKNSGNFYDVALTPAYQKIRIPRRSSKFR